MTQTDRLGEVLVEPQRTCNRACDAGRLERVREPRPVVVAGWVDEHLRLVHQPPEGLRVDDPVAISLKRGPQQARLFRLGAATRLVGAHRER